VKATQPLTWEAVALSFADRATPRRRLGVGDRHGTREERRTLETSTEVVTYLAQPEAVDPQDGEAGTLASWPALGPVGQIVREVEDVGGTRVGETRRAVASALTSLTPAQADPAQLLARWRGHWPIENGLHSVRDVTLGEDAGQVRSGPAPAVFAACRHATRNLLRRAGCANIAAALRRHAMYPRMALALLGIQLA
jgi:predicted transposase YbfD/YdcC